jgi:hypothetical protein
VLLSHTRLRGRFVLHLAVGNLRTQLSHIEQAQRLIGDAHQRLLNGSPE